MLDLVGNTPVVRINHLTDAHMADIYVKLEGMNLTGSVKARAALGMILAAEEKGFLKSGMTIIEPSSGNTGIALALIGKLMGYPVTIVMPDTMSVERRKIIKAYGAELLLTDGAVGMRGAIEEATRLSETPHYYMPQQFNNPANSQIHFDTTALEILSDFDHLDAFVASVGTGGTITGVGKRLKINDASIKIIAVEPEESPVLSGGAPGPHKIQGIGAGFIPSILDLDIIDEIIHVNSERAYSMTRLLFEKEGLFLGISSGATMVAALEVAKALGKGKKVLMISPDQGEKYLSNQVFA